MNMLVTLIYVAGLVSLRCQQASQPPSQSFRWTAQSKSERHNLCISLWQLLLIYINHTLILAPQKIHFNRFIPACPQVALGVLLTSPPPTSFFFFFSSWANRNHTTLLYLLFLFFAPHCRSLCSAKTWYAQITAYCPAAFVSFHQCSILRGPVSRFLLMV